jgi:methylmalonyl-CoA carboxyltransferase large subunit
LATLTERLDELSHQLNAVQHRLDAFHPADELPDEVLLAIGAACAAYLGKRARVKQVRRRPASGWSKRGRYDIHYSHRQAHAGY